MKTSKCKYCGITIKAQDFKNKKEKETCISCLSIENGMKYLTDYSNKMFNRKLEIKEYTITKLKK